MHAVNFPRFELPEDIDSGCATTQQTALTGLAAISGSPIQCLGSSRMQRQVMGSLVTVFSCWLTLHIHLERKDIFSRRVRTS